MEMKTLSEYELRAMCLASGTKEYRVEEGTFITPMAREYLRDRGITLTVVPRGSSKVMPQTPMGEGREKYRSALTGEPMAEKPEEMTHLRGNLLVPKTHPRILLRGRLDSLEAKILELQLLAWEEGCRQLTEDLGELLDFVRELLAAEVKDTPFTGKKLLGMDSDRLRYVSHHVREEIGIDHPVPDYRMGRLAVALNSLRTQVRETELAAVTAFSTPGERVDLIQALNRLSSCVYILFCRRLAGYYGKGDGK